MITERDNIKCKASLDMIEKSALDLRTKADLKDSIEEAKLNLNGRTLEERVLSIAQNQFDTTRFLADIIIKFNDNTKSKQPSRSWKDVIVETKWAMCALGGIIFVCMVFQPQIIEFAKCVASLIH